MKKLMMCLAIVIALVMVTTSAMAITAALQTVLDNITVAPSPTPGASSVNVFTDYVSDNLDTAWGITGTGGSVSTMIIELASFAPINTFGVYDLTNPMNKVEIFSGADSAGAQKQLGMAANGDVYVWGTYQATFGSTKFGFYLDSSAAGTGPTGPGGVWYSDSSLNYDGGMDHMYAYQGPNVDWVQILPWAAGPWTDSEYVIAFEDLHDLAPSDWDFTDMVVMVESIYPIPEPCTLLLLGLGLIGVAGISKKKFKF
jgi:hypothetical protein